MDALGDLLRDVRARGSLYGSSTLTAPWLLSFVDGAPLTLCSVLQGSGWVIPAGQAPERIVAGEMMIIRGPAPFTFVDEVGTHAEIIECGVQCATEDDGGTLHRLGWNDPLPLGDDEATVMVAAAYPIHGEIGRRLLGALPVVVRVDAGGAAGAVRDLVAIEVAVDAPGQQIVLDRLLDWMLVCSLREWFERPGTDAPAWYSAHRDPVVGRALKILHAEPATSWTVASIADQVGVSRATLAKRFKELVDETPMAYLTRWRMTLAADLLTSSTTDTIAAIARTVGYADAFTFSAAFKRIRGVSPSMYRNIIASSGTAGRSASAMAPISENVIVS